MRLESKTPFEYNKLAAILKTIDELKPEGKANADCFDTGDGVTANDAYAIQRLDAGVIIMLPEYSNK